MSTPTPQRRPVRPGLQRSLPWLGALLIAVVLLSSALDIRHRRELALQQTGRELDTQARIMAEQTARSLQAVDVVLRHLVQQYRQGALDHLGPTEWHAHLREQALGLVQTDGLVLTDSEGVARAVSRFYPLPQPPPNITGTAIFKRMRGGSVAELSIDHAVRSTVDGEWVIPMGRRLETRDGRFDGVVGARGRVEYYQSFYRDIRLEPGTTAALMHSDGTLLARYPAAPEALGRRFELLDEMVAGYRSGQSGPLRSTSPIDGVERYSIVQRVPDYPLVMVVTRDADLALAAWRAQSLSSAAATLALALLAALLLALATRQIARLQATRESLEAARERFDLAVQGSDDGIWDWDPCAGQMFASARARELLGMPPGPETQPVDEWFAAVKVHADDEQRRWAAVDAHLAGQTPAYEEEFRVLHGDGSYRWVRVRGVGVRDAQGRALRMAGSVSDVDSRRRAEEALRQSEQRFALAVAGSQDGVVDWDIVRDRMFSSERTLQIIGLNTAQTLRTRAEWLALLRLHPDDVQRHADDFARHLRGESEVREGEYRLQHPDGQYRWVRVRGKSVRNAAGEAVRWAGSVSDIDEQKRIEQALRQSEERYQLAVAGSNEGLWDWDMRSDLLFMSARAQSLFGITPGEPLRPRREWIAGRGYHPDDRLTVRRALSAHLRGRASHFVCEYRMKHASGDWHWYRQRGIAVRDAQGRPYRLAGSMEDVTERHQAEAQRDRLEGQLRQAQKLEAMGTLAGGIAHDFNNILAAILGYGEMAQREAQEGSAQRRHIDAAMSAGLRAKSLVERILAFSRSGVGERVPVHVRAVVSEALDLLAASLPTGVRIEHQLDCGDAALLGDPTQLHQVVMNLCANAVQAMRAAGTITVRCEEQPLDEPLPVATNTLAAGRYVSLSVRDTGMGMAPQLLERIFDPFFTTKEVGVGTGLGLSLVHGIVMDLGGGIAVDSRLGEGSCFVVYLPWQLEIAAPARVEELVPSGAGETVLLVDDEEPLVQLGEEMLAQLGYEPVGFSSSAAALASFRATPQRFQVVLSDEAMPELTGSELAREVHRLRPDLPIILMSGFVSPALQARGREAGVREVLAKPLVLGDIARSLAAALSTNPDCS